MDNNAASAARHERFEPTEIKTHPASEAKTHPASEASMMLIRHHLQSFQDNDLAAVMSDYTDQSVLISQTGTYIGLQQIQGFFTGLVTHFPAETSTVDVDQFTAEGELVYLIWHAKTPTLEVAFGADTFIVKNNKIDRQTFAGQLTFTMP